MCFITLPALCHIRELSSFKVSTPPCFKSGRQPPAHHTRHNALLPSRWQILSILHLAYCDISPSLKEADKKHFFDSKHQPRQSFARAYHIYPHPIRHAHDVMPHLHQHSAAFASHAPCFIAKRVPSSKRCINLRVAKARKRVRIETHKKSKETSSFIKIPEACYDLAYLRLVHLLLYPVQSRATNDKQEAPHALSVAL